MKPSLAIPKDLKEFWNIFEMFSRRHNYSSSFQDVVFCLLAQYNPNKQMDAELLDSMKKYSNQEKALMASMHQSLIECYEKRISVDGWADPLGEIYEIIVSTGKASMMGQFFTPKDVSDLMSRMTIDPSNRNISVSDPTCGSGRNLLSANSIMNNGCNKNVYYGEDLDYLCCIMTLLNMIHHNMAGEVVHHDTLRINFYHAWKVFPVSKFSKYAVPYVLEITEQESDIMNYWKAKSNTKDIEDKSIKKDQANDSPVQLNLFA